MANLKIQDLLRFVHEICLVENFAPVAVQNTPVWSGYFHNDDVHVVHGLKPLPPLRAEVLPCGSASHPCKEGKHFCGEALYHIMVSFSNET